jgi:hypothetical protein
MAWETRPWTTTPNKDVMLESRRCLRRRVRLMLDPRSFETDDANELRVEGTVLACSSNGPTLFLEEPNFTVPLIDVLVIEPIEEGGI